MNLTFLEQLTLSIGAVFNTIEATMRTEGLLTQSQQLTVELQSRQSELQQTNEELGTKARLLAEQNAEVERKNAEVEQARGALEEKAAELALTSKYKSEFLANMSHELRTPLNSILILSQQLAENAAGNLVTQSRSSSRATSTPRARTCCISSTTFSIFRKSNPARLRSRSRSIAFSDLRETIDRNFRHVAEAKHLPFHVHFDPDLPREMDSDPKRLQQILKNLLSNAVKFTAHGHVKVRVGLATQGWSAGSRGAAAMRSQVVAFAVEDTGIGVAPEKQRLIFEAFQQADAGTSPQIRRHRLGTGHQPRTRDAARRRNQALERAWARAAPSRCTCRCTTPVRTRRGRRRANAFRDGPLLDRVTTVLPAAREEHIADDRDAIEPGDTVLLIIEDDPHYARILLGLARDTGLQRHRRDEGRRRPGARASVSTRGHHARHLPARHARLDGSEPAQARSRDAAHSGADRDAG